MYTKCLNECRFLVLPVHTFTIRKLYATSKKSNHSYFPCIPNVSRKCKTDSIFIKMVKIILRFNELLFDGHSIIRNVLWIWTIFRSPVQMFTARTLHASVYSNHPHFLCRSKKVHSESFLPRAAISWDRFLHKCFPDHDKLNLFKIRVSHYLGIWYQGWWWEKVWKPLLLGGKVTAYNFIYWRLQTLPV